MSERVAALEDRLRTTIVEEYVDVVCKALMFDSYAPVTIHSVSEDVRKRCYKIAEAVYAHGSTRQNKPGPEDGQKEKETMPGKTVYEAYCAARGNFDNLPAFESLRPTVQSAWAQAEKTAMELGRAR